MPWKELPPPVTEDSAKSAIQQILEKLCKAPWYEDTRSLSVMFDCSTYSILRWKMGQHKPRIEHAEKILAKAKELGIKWS